MRPQIVKKISFLFVHFFMSVSVLAQQQPPPPENMGTPPHGLPIDSSIFILIVLGLLLGTYFLLKKKKAKL